MASNVGWNWGCFVGRMGERRKKGDEETGKNATVPLMIPFHFPSIFFPSSSIDYFRVFFSFFPLNERVDKTNRKNANNWTKR